MSSIIPALDETKTTGKFYSQYFF